jgi:acyl transferase domain-containing protein
VRSTSIHDNSGQKNAKRRCFNLLYAAMASSNGARFIMNPTFFHILHPILALTQVLATSSDQASLWTHHEQHRFPAAEAHQGVAVDATHFYAITNTAIGKYMKATGEKVGGWQAHPDSHFKHLNAGLILDGKLWCAHSNYPAMPMQSSVEIWDPATMQHLLSIDLSHIDGSLTWVDRRGGVWFACFAQYAKTGDPAQTRIVTFDADWKRRDTFRFPPEAIVKFGKNSSSGGSFGPGDFLFITGHDAQELYLLTPPTAGEAFAWHGALAITAHGQAFAWDRSDPGTLYSIDRKSREVIVSRLTRSASNPAPSSAVAPPPDSAR